MLVSRIIDLFVTCVFDLDQFPGGFVREHLNNLADWFIAVGRMEPKYVSEIFDNFRPVELKAGQYFVRAGDLNPGLAYIQKGLFKSSFDTPDGKEVIQALFGEREIMCPYAEVVGGYEAMAHMIAVEDSLIYVMEAQRFRRLLETQPFLDRAARLLAEKYLVARVMRERILLIGDARSRLQFFRENFGKFESRLKRSEMAAFVGVDPATLSRIDKRRD